MKTVGLAIVAALYSATLGPAAAQSSSISTTAPLPKIDTTAHAGHKPKAASHTAKQTVPDSEPQKTAPKTIPMDFSGMARRPVDLKSETNPNSSFSKPEKSDTSGNFEPHIGAGQAGGLSPGMKIGF